MVVVVPAATGRSVVGGNFTSGSVSGRSSAELIQSSGRLSDSRLLTRSMPLAIPSATVRPAPSSWPLADFTRLPDASRQKDTSATRPAFHAVFARIPIRRFVVMTQNWK